MSVDMKVELFSADLFRCLWCKSNLVVSVLPRMSCYGNEQSECSQAVINAVYCRQRLFRQKLVQSISRDYLNYSRCGVDFYLYLRNNIDVYLPYAEMSIFDKMFMTCAVVLEMAYWCATNENKMYMYHAPLCWAMFFDTDLKEEFHAEGGWDNLQRYAGSYDTKILSEPFLAAFCIHPDDHLNAKELLKASNDDYNLSELYEKFKQRCYERESEDKTSCSKCHPLFIALNETVFPSDAVGEQSKLVEGYLQIFLSMMTYEEMDELEANVKYQDTDTLEGAEHLDGDQAENTPCSEKKELVEGKKELVEGKKELVEEKKELVEEKKELVEEKKELVEEKKELVEEKKELVEEKKELVEEKKEKEHKVKIYRERLKALATVELIDRLFADDLNYNPDAPDWCEDDVLCIFCGRNINQPIKPIKKDKQGNRIKQINSAIYQTLEETRFKIPAVPEAKCSSEVENSQEQGVVLKTKKHSKSEVDLSNGRNNSDVKDALKMFLTLGIEPAKTSMLSILKESESADSKIEGNETENHNLQNEKDDSRPVVAEEAQTAKGAKKKKKSKKKKNKNSKVTETPL